MAMKKSLWDMILKVVIAVASAVAGVLGANAMNLENSSLVKGKTFFPFHKVLIVSIFKIITYELFIKI